MFREQSPHEIDSVCDRMKNQVMQEFEQDPKCGDFEVEELWRQKLFKLLDQIQFGFVVSALLKYYIR